MSKRELRAWPLAVIAIAIVFCIISLTSKGHSQTVSASQLSDAAASLAPPSQPTDVPAAVGAATSAWKAFAAKHYREGVAFALLVVMFVWRRFLSRILIGRISTWWAGFFTVLGGFLATLPAALIVAPFSWPDFIMNSLISSGEAMVFWQVVLKKIPWFRIPEPSPAPPPTPA